MQAEQLKMNKVIDLDKFNEIKEAGDQYWQVYLAAKEYISQGIYVIPLRKNSKFLPEASHNINYGSASRKPETIEKWFHPMEGKFKGWNIGIATGREGGVFVVDIDRKGEKDGFITWAELTEKEEPIVSPIQTTMNGGHHLLFNWQEHAISSVEKIGPGIDTRGGTDNACKGHIVVFPSIVDGKQYTWSQGGEIEDVPRWVMEKMGVSWRAKSFGSGRGNENISADDEEQQVPIEQIVRMLKNISPDDTTYDEWLRIGQAINSQQPTNIGLDLWDQWSQTGSRYEQNECALRWRGFDPSGPIRMGSLFYYAKDAGWEPEKGDIKKSNPLDEVVERINKQHAIIVVGGKVKVLREKSHVEDAILGHYELLGVNDFQSLLQNDVVFIEDKKGNSKPIGVTKIWLGHEGRRTYPNGMGLFPDGKHPPGYYNTWNGFSVEPMAGNCPAFLNHIKEVICNGNEDHYDWLLDWCADSVQDPANPKGTAVVMRGEEGAGKGTLANTMGRLFGSHYRHLIDDSHLLSNFNAHMIDALFVFADEITWGGNKKTAGKLKGMVTERYLVGERKGVDAVGYRNMIHIMIASNGEWVVPAGQNSRRWFILDVPDNVTTNRDHFNKIAVEMDNGGTEAFLHMLLEREITNDLRRAPETKVLKEQRMRSAATDSLLSWWIRAVDRRAMDVPDIMMTDPSDVAEWPEAVTKQDLYDDYEKYCIDRKIMPEQLHIFYDKIVKFGLKKNRRMIHKVKRHLYEIPKLKIAQMILSEKFNIENDEDEEDGK